MTSSRWHERLDHAARRAPARRARRDTRSPAAPGGGSCAFARPYRRDIAVFLVTVVIAAGHRRGHAGAGRRRGQHDHRRRLRGAAADVIRIALLIAGLAVVDALLSLAQRWYSARIGEGIILDLRTQVYDHVQRMPLQFFTRTQTGALVSRLNNDVLGAQRAFTSTLSGVVSNVIQLVLTAAVMFTLSWQITAAVAGRCCRCSSCRPAGSGGSWPTITRESYNLDAKMNATMTERFGVAGALLVKLFGQPETEASPVRRRGPSGSATSASSQAMYSRTFFVAMLLVASLAQALTYGLGGWFAVQRHGQRRHGGHPGAAADPALRAADRAVQRPGRRDERAGLLRPGLRGARPARRRSPRSPTRSPCRAAPARVEFRDVQLPLPDAPPRCRWPRWKTSPRSTAPSPSRCCAASRSPSSRGRWSRWSARPAPASRPRRCWCPGSTT